MNIGILGAGVVAQTIAKHVLPFGHRVLLSNRRGGDSLAALVRELGSGATAGTPQQAAERTRPCSSSNWTDARSPGEPEQITVGTGVSLGARSNLEVRDARYEQAAAIIFTDFTPR
jgi:hypothetical protein